MPRRQEFTHASVAELARQWRFTSAQTRRRLIHAAQALGAEIDTALTYPMDFVVFRLAGYRPERADGEPLTLRGRELLADLSVLALHLSEAQPLAPEELGERSIPLAEAAAIVGVSSKSLQRYRRMGLFVYWVQTPEGPRLHCLASGLDRLKSRLAAEAPRAGRGVRRIDAQERRRIISRAVDLSAGAPLTLNQAASLLAAEFGRGRDTIRQVLRRHDERAAEPIFGTGSRLTDHQKRVAWRAWRRGVPRQAIAARFGHSPLTIARAVRQRHAEVLRALRPEWIELPTFARADAQSVILAAPVVLAAACAAQGHEQITDARHWIAQMRSVAGAEEAHESALLGAWYLLRRRIHHATAALPVQPGAHALDQIETDARLLSAVGDRLVAGAAPPLLRRLDQLVGGPVQSLPAELLQRALRAMFIAIGQALESVDPSRSQRLERRGAWILERLVAEQALVREHRAQPRAAGAPVVMRPPMRLALPWLAAHDLLLSSHALQRRPSLAPSESHLIDLRFGLSGRAPATMRAIAVEMGLPLALVTRRIHRAEGRLRWPGPEGVSHAAE